MEEILLSRAELLALRSDVGAPEHPPQSVAAATAAAEEEPGALPLSDKILMIRRLLDSGENLIENLEAVEKDTDEMMNDVIMSGRGVFQNNIESEHLLALIFLPPDPNRTFRYGWPPDTGCHRIAAYPCRKGIC